MSIGSTELLLTRFGYQFKKEGKKLIIKSDFAQRISIDFSKPEAIIIKDKLVGWNFLSGIIEMRLKYAILYNFICLILLTVLFLVIDFKADTIHFLLILTAITIWILLWSIYYTIKFESLKQTLIRWNSTL